LALQREAAAANDDVDEVKHGFRFIVGYKAACIIPQADVKTVK